MIYEKCPEPKNSKKKNPWNKYHVISWKIIPVVFFRTPEEGGIFAGD